MTSEPLPLELDFNPLVTTLLEKTRGGKLKWQPTANEKTFVCSIEGQTTVKLTLTTVELPLTNPFALLSGRNLPGDVFEEPTLSLVDAEGREFWKAPSSTAQKELWALYRLVRRVANNVDERVATLVEALQRM